MLTSPPAQLTVDLGSPIKRVDHAASGSLYGLAGEGRPPDHLALPLRPKMFTQMAAHGGQLPNGELVAAGDVLDVASMAALYGASVTVRMPDSFETFPYQWISWDDWLGRVERQVADVQRAGLANVYAYELWNEPNWTWQPDVAGPFLDGWARTWQAIRAFDPHTPVMGPSIDRWDREWVGEFLVHALASSTLPDVMSWHELDPADGHELEAHVAEYRALEASLGIEPRPISINEYGAHRDMADPGALGRFIARIERSQVDTANIAFWHRPGRLADLVTADGQPTGAWWLYRWYGEMTGWMVAAAPQVPSRDGADVFASYDESRSSASVVVAGAVGDVDVRVAGATAVAGADGDVLVEAWLTRWTGTDGPLVSVEELFSGIHHVVDGVLTVELRGMRPDEAVQLTLSPAAGPAHAVGRPVPYRRRYEVEDGRITRGSVERVDMRPAAFRANKFSGDAFVSWLNEIDSAVELDIEAPHDGEHVLVVGYTNGGEVAQHRLWIDGTYVATVTYPPTQGRELVGSVAVSVHLEAGEHVLRLAKGTLVGDVCLDFVDVTAVGPQAR